MHYQHANVFEGVLKLKLVLLSIVLSTPFVTIISLKRGAFLRAKKKGNYFGENATILPLTYHFINPCCEIQLNKTRNASDI